ncbi:MAG: hypothetical protein HQL87_01725 [Magnetococcales bacterium]|nr:hypothetical protein [Magnetococcales bacterium]
MRLSFNHGKGIRGGGSPLGGLLCRAVLLALLVSGCTTLPKKESARWVDPRITQERFQADRQQRLDRLHRWQVSGVLEVITERGSRRYRTEIRGEAAQQARVSLLGLMQQVVAVLFAGSQEIRLVDAEKQRIVEVPASAEGLNHLIGIGLQPEELLEAMIGLAGELTERETDISNGWLTRMGERLVLDPETGLMQERSGQTEAGGSYRVVYQWPEAVDKSSLPMPAHIQVVLLPGGTEVNYTAHQWQMVDKPFAANWFSALELYAGFAVERPFQDRAQPQ